MRIYFSGGNGLKTTPEALVPNLRPHIMLSYNDIHQNKSGVSVRLESYLKQGKKKKKP